MQFEIYVLVLMISVSCCLPQLSREQYPYWRNRPRSIPTYGYYSNQPELYRYPGTRQYENRGYYVPVPVRGFRGPSARRDDVKEVRIMNYPTEGASMSDAMYNDQNTDFVFPGFVNNPRLTTKRPVAVVAPEAPVVPSSSSQKNPYIPDVDTILKNCADSATFCELIEDYPKDYIHNYIKESPESYNDLFGTDELIPSVNISTRIGVGDGDGTPMCQANEKVIQPPVAKNADDQWKYIVNDEKYIQGIRVEICQSPGEPCAMSQNFPLSYETECKQKFIFRKLLALDPSGDVQSDNFRLPSCCVCVYRAKRVLRSIFKLK